MHYRYYTYETFYYTFQPPPKIWIAPASIAFALKALGLHLRSILSSRWRGLSSQYPCQPVPGTMS